MANKGREGVVRRREEKGWRGFGKGGMARKEGVVVAEGGMARKEGVVVAIVLFFQNSTTANISIQQCIIIWLLWWLDRSRKLQIFNTHLKPHI